MDLGALPFIRRGVVISSHGAVQPSSCFRQWGHDSPDSWWLLETVWDFGRGHLIEIVLVPVSLPARLCFRYSWIICCHQVGETKIGSVEPRLFEWIQMHEELVAETAAAAIVILYVHDERSDVSRFHLTKHLVKEIRKRKVGSVTTFVELQIADALVGK